MFASGWKRAGRRQRVSRGRGSAFTLSLPAAQRHRCSRHRTPRCATVGLVLTSSSGTDVHEEEQTKHANMGNRETRREIQFLHSFKNDNLIKFVIHLSLISSQNTIMVRLTSWRTERFLHAGSSRDSMGIILLYLKFCCMTRHTRFRKTREHGVRSSRLKPPKHNVSRADMTTRVKQNTGSSVPSRK